MLTHMPLRIVHWLSVIVFTFVLWLQGSKQAFVQKKPLIFSESAEALREAKIIKHGVLPMILSLYGLVESSLCFSNACYLELVNIPKISPCEFKPCFSFKTNDYKLCSTTGLGINYSINTGSAEYWANQKKATKTFILKKKVFSLRSPGLLIHRKSNSSFVLPPEQIDLLRDLDCENISYHAFCFVCLQLLFNLQFYEPDVSQNASQTSQVNHDGARSSDAKLFKQFLKRFQKAKYLKLR